MPKPMTANIPVSPNVSFLPGPTNSDAPVKAPAKVRKVRAEKVESDEEPIKLKALKQDLSELKTLCTRAQDAASAYQDACKASAKRAGLLQQVVKVYVTALVKDTWAKHEQKSTQMSLLFEEMP